MATLTIYSVDLGPHPAASFTGTFVLTENYMGAPMVASATVSIDTFGVLAVPLVMSGLILGQTYKLKLTLDCGCQKIKIITLVAVCTTVTDLAVVINGTATGVNLTFTPVPGVTNYSVEIYIDNEPTSGGILVGTYSISTTTGNVTIISPAIIMNGRNYYARIKTICSGSQSPWSDFVPYAACSIFATATATTQVVGAFTYVALIVNTTHKTTIDTNYMVEYLNSNNQWMSWWYVVVPADSLTGGPDLTDAIVVVPGDMPTGVARVIGVSPNPAAGCIIQF